MRASDNEMERAQQQVLDLLREQFPDGAPWHALRDTWRTLAGNYHSERTLRRALATLETCGAITTKGGLRLAVDAEPPAPAGPPVPSVPPATPMPATPMPATPTVAGILASLSLLDVLPDLAGDDANLTAVRRLDGQRLRLAQRYEELDGALLLAIRGRLSGTRGAKWSRYLRRRWLPVTDVYARMAAAQGKATSIPRWKLAAIYDAPLTTATTDTTTDGG